MLELSTDEVDVVELRVVDEVICVDEVDAICEVDATVDVTLLKLGSTKYRNPIVGERVQLPGVNGKFGDAVCPTTSIRELPLSPATSYALSTFEPPNTIPNSKAAATCQMHECNYV